MPEFHLPFVSIDQRWSPVPSWPCITYWKDHFSFLSHSDISVIKFWSSSSSSLFRLMLFLHCLCCFSFTISVHIQSCIFYSIVFLQNCLGCFWHLVFPYKSEKNHFVNFTNKTGLLGLLFYLRGRGRKKMRENASISSFTFQMPTVVRPGPSQKLGQSGTQSRCPPHEWEGPNYSCCLKLAWSSFLLGLESSFHMWDAGVLTIQPNICPPAGFELKWHRFSKTGRISTLAALGFVIHVFSVCWGHSFQSF